MNSYFKIFITVLIALYGCQSATDKLKKDFMPIARGEADEIILVMDSLQWEGQLGDQLKGMFRQYMKMLPQDEYEYSMSKVNPRKLNDVLKNAKNMIFVMTLDAEGIESRNIREYFTDNSLKMIKQDSSLFYTVRRDEFAKGQIVLYLFSQSEEQLVNKLADNKASLVALFESAVRERVREQVLSKKESEMMAAITEKHGYSIGVPYGWDKAADLDNFIWLRKLEADYEQNVFVYETDYVTPDVFDDVALLRDEVTTTYLRDSQKPELFIDRQTTIPVYTERVSFKGQFAVEARGLWKVSNSSAGGPFVSYSFVDQASQKLYYIEGYVYAAGMKKKPLVREVEAILSTFNTSSEAEITQN